MHVKGNFRVQKAVKRDINEEASHDEVGAHLELRFDGAAEGPH